MNISKKEKNAYPAIFSLYSLYHKGEKMKTNKNKIKIKYKDIFRVLLGLASAGLVIHDFILVLILYKCGWTWYGFFTFLTAVCYLVYCFDYFYVRGGE